MSRMHSVCKYSDSWGLLVRVTVQTLGGTMLSSKIEVRVETQQLQPVSSFVGSDLN